MNALMVFCCGNEKPRILAKFQKTGFLNELLSLKTFGGGGGIYSPLVRSNPRP
jgi:hypothetical protein